jgi:sulfur carrier protein
MRITVNGEPRDLPEGCSLEGLLRELGLPPQAQATALNGEFVPRTSRADQPLRDGDAVTCFEPIVGG